MSSDDRSRQLATTFLEVLSSGDLEKVRPLLHEDCTWHVMATGIPGVGAHTGRDFIVDEFLTPIRGMFDPGEPKVYVDNMIAEGAQVAVQCRGIGRFKNGKEYSNVYCWIFQFRDDKLYSLHEYMDSYYISTLV